MSYTTHIYSYDPFEAIIDRENGRYTVTINFAHDDTHVTLDEKTFPCEDDAYDWALGSIDEFIYSLSSLMKKVEGVA